MHICAQEPLGALALISPFTSIKGVAENMAGSLGRALVRQRFDNLSKIRHVSAPILLIHGDRDTLIPLAQSEALAGRRG